MKKVYLVVFYLFVVLSSFAQDSTIKIIEVEPYKEIQNYEHFKRLVLVSNDNNIEYIKDFKFEWGFNYTLKIKERKLPSTLSDGTRYEHELIEIISKTFVSSDYSFHMGLTPDVYYDDSESSLKKVSDNIYRYLDEVNIVIPNNVAIEFSKYLKEKKYLRAKFSCVDGSTIMLQNL